VMPTVSTPGRQPPADDRVEGTRRAGRVACTSRPARASS
jgi:hypothetical protein